VKLNKISARALTVGAAFSAALTLVAAPWAAASSSPARARPSAAATVITWKNDYPFHGQYLQISHSGTTDGAWAEVRNGPGDSNEHWYSIPLGNSQYAFKNLNSRKCLNEDFPNTALRHVDQRGCGTFHTSRRWTENHITGTNLYELFPVGGTTGLAACPDNQRWIVMGAPGSGDCFFY